MSSAALSDCTAGKCRLKTPLVLANSSAMLLAAKVCTDVISLPGSKLSLPSA